MHDHPDRPDFSDLPNLDTPAVGRYGATTPELLRWFKVHNVGRPYCDQVRPFNFMLTAQAHTPTELDGTDSGGRSQRGPLSARKAPKPPQPVAPYASDYTTSSPQWFDRETGQPVPDRDLKTYRQALAQYHLHPEDKFLNGDYTDRGPTHRRHVEVIGVHQVGKEANRLDQQLHLGYDSNAQLEYGVEPKASNQVLREVGEAVEIYGVSGLARDAGLSRQYVSSIVNGRVRPSPGHSIN